MTARTVAAKGELTLTLDDGREATLVIDLDLSHPGASWGIENDYAEGWPHKGRPVGTTFSVYIPTASQVDRPLFTFRIPQLCPECKRPVKWDTEHLPYAWRHVDSESRWCEPSGGKTELPYPKGATDPDRINA